MDVDPSTGKTHVLVSAGKMAPLNESTTSERDRDHRERYDMASYRVGAGLGAPALRRRWPPVALRSAQRHRSRDRLLRPCFRRRSQVLARRLIRLFYPRSRLVHHPAARTGLTDDCSCSCANIPPPAARRSSMARWIGSTRKSSTCAATTSGRPIQRTSPICR